MIIDGTFFTGDISIAGLNVNDAESPTVRAKIDNLMSYVNRYEPKYLEYLLGEELSRRFIDYVGSKSKGNDAFDSLLGKLVTETGDNKYSPIAYYVYFYFVRGNQQQATILGVKRFEEDEELVSPNTMLIYAWNNMADMTYKVYRYLCDNKDKYEGWRFDRHLLEKINSFGL